MTSTFDVAFSKRLCRERDSPGSILLIRNSILSLTVKRSSTMSPKALASSKRLRTFWKARIRSKIEASARGTGSSSSGLGSLAEYVQKSVLVQFRVDEENLRHL